MKEEKQMTVQTLTPIALKEWAVAVEALAEGKQILLMRKGGIHEETRHFQVEADTFFLYPTYEHQQEQADLVKPEFQDKLQETMKEWNPEAKTNTVKYFARLAEDIEILDEEALNRLSSFHIWVPDFAVKRLKWKRKQPLHLLLVRTYRLERPLEVPILEEYLGCRSWIRLPEELIRETSAAEPVLSDAEFGQQVQEIKQALGRA
jgi:hypothetical protein